jgi:hypothetical protein
MAGTFAEIALPKQTEKLFRISKYLRIMLY